MDVILILGTSIIYLQTGTLVFLGMLVGMLNFVSTVMNTPVVPETEEALEPRKNIKKVAPVPEEKGQVVVTKGHEESA